jgi:hypothetical protein
MIPMQLTLIEMIVNGAYHIPLMYSHVQDGVVIDKNQIDMAFLTDSVTIIKRSPTLADDQTALIGVYK